MSIEKIYDGAEYKEVEIQNESSETLRNIIKAWKENPEDFAGDVRQVKADSSQKIRMGEAVFERKDGKYILRKSSEAY